MDIHTINDNVLKDLMGRHRSYFVTSLLSGRLEASPLSELMLYAYGTLAGHPEIDQARVPRPVRDHEGFDDCETSAHFWRGVFDVRGTMFMFYNKREKKKSGETSYGYPLFRVRGSQLLLSRMYDFFKLWSPYPDAASDRFLEQIDNEQGVVELRGLPAQMAAYNLYGNACVGAYVDRSEEIADWRPHNGWFAGDGAGAAPKKLVDFSALLPIPKGVFDAT
jgi:hypothetical protein